MIPPGAECETSTLNSKRLTDTSQAHETHSAATDANSLQDSHHVGFHDNTSKTTNIIIHMSADVLPLPSPLHIAGPSAELSSPGSRRGLPRPRRVKFMQDDSTPKDRTYAVIPELDGDLVDNMSARVDFCTLTGFFKDEIPARCTLSHVYDLVRVPHLVLQLVKASTMDGNQSWLVLNCRCALGCLACAFHGRSHLAVKKEDGKRKDCLKMLEPGNLLSWINPKICSKLCAGP
jgi:hypothetical protein